MTVRAQVDELLAPVDRLLSVGLVPLLAASAARRPGQSAAAAYLYAHPSTRAALEGVVRSLREASARARSEADRGRIEAVQLAQAIRRQGLAFVTDLARALPQADRVLNELRDNLASAPLQGLGFGLGLGLVGLALLLAFASSKG